MVLASDCGVVQHVSALHNALHVVALDSCCMSALGIGRELLFTFEEGLVPYMPPGVRLSPKLYLTQAGGSHTTVCSRSP